ncbi:class I SAM-dependent methyltransferase [Mesorhizobium sp. M0960]|uniref:class I SAM-dependent methyltransferase n=1 Tax=Mesorhizobium sp. M0960 TaxID=2957035 RepID=UPI00333A5563
MSRLMGDLQVAVYESAIQKYARGRLIDLGCGNAPLAGIYRSVVDEYLWADWANSAHQRFDLDFEVNLNNQLPFEDQSFDTILLTDVLEHLAEPDLLFSELARMLKPGGHIIVGVPFFYYLHEEPHDHFRYTKFALAHFGLKHHVPPVEIIEAGGAFDVWSDLTGKLLGGVWKPLARIPYHGWMIAKLLPTIRRLNERAAWRFPLAYVAVYARPAEAE